MSDRPHSDLSHLVVVTSSYPASACPAKGTFVRQFAHAVARQGVQCTVIQPVAIHHAWRRDRYPFHHREEAGEGKAVDVYRPRFLSLSAREAFNFLGPLSPSRMTLNRFTAAVRRVLLEKELCPDALYGHFLYFAGAAVVRVGGEMDIPAFPCVGEGELWTVRRFGFAHARRALQTACGFMANSSALKQTLICELGVAGDHIGVFPNGADLSKFRPRDQKEARNQFGLPHDRFLVGSAGNFLSKKGVVRVGEAIDGLEGVAGVFAGSGPLPPRASNMALCRRVPHEEMPALLSACDVFALPTQIEGSCNALVEAMACGLPIISSIGEFNDDLLDANMSIRIDPLDVPAIRNAIVRLRDEPDLRKRMAEAALQRAKQFDIEDRAQRMLKFMSERIRKSGKEEACEHI